MKTDVLIKGNTMKKVVFNQIEIVQTHTYKQFIDKGPIVRGLGFTILPDTGPYAKNYFIFEDKKTGRLFKFQVDDYNFKCKYPQIFIV